ncbi:hypothetical protein JQ609_19995 [Bradyrhizobium sp. AUGA SZCCT0169]|uniref:DUF6932 family protein n=1 Tax=Bradyrhizobium sp. AUGA SZCCT0169 TaxID=2807663 RepID=UPI001BAE2C33|nr:hypothetical protein [Bradyrhizobium sp. AUGA SZCCT0169]MBR1249197.1 hypothetical protein [Bradyrhizobium sp. AUGA SZCCT0169]
MSSKFNGHGYLDAGLHVFESGEFEAQFVTSFPHSPTRQSILNGYIQHSKDLVGLVGACEQFLDGSFVTSKNDPGDIDFVIFIDATVVDALPHDKQQELMDLVAGPSTKTKYLCDAYFCPIYPAGHPMNEPARAKRKYWMGEFGYDRSDVPKGIVHMKYAAPAPANTSAP